jgi:AAA family ATP:ADP antiporter
MFLWFFLTICSYYVIRPVRTALVLYDFGPENLPWVYMGTGLAAGLAAYVFSKFSKARRRRLISGTLLFFTSNLVFWWWVAGESAARQAAGLGPLAWTSPVFYVWTDVFSVMAVTVFWMYASDVFGKEGAKRTFGILAAAGPSGGAAGAWLTRTIVGELGPVDVVLVAAGIFASTLVLFLVIEAVTKGRSSIATAWQGKENLDLRKLPEVVRQVLRSRLLWLIVIVVCFERIAPDMVDYVFQNTAKAHFPDKPSYAEFFASFDMWRNILVLIGSLFVTPILLTRGGPGPALISVPLSILIFGVAMLIVPSLGAVVVLKGFEEGQRHAWFKAGKETLYSATSRDVVYTIKGYIEMFLYRFSRGFAGFILLLVTLGLKMLDLAKYDIVVVTWIMLPMAVVWAWACWQAGREFRKLDG